MITNHQFALHLISEKSYTQPQCRRSSGCSACPAVSCETGENDNDNSNNNKSYSVL